MNDLLWSGEVPNTPISPVKRQTIGLRPEDEAAIAARVREALKHPHRVATPAPKAAPAKVEAVAAPEPASSAAPTRLCACGCGRPIRPSNESGYSKHCDAQRYAIEHARNSSATAFLDRPARSAAANPEPPATPVEDQTMACKDCGSKTIHRADCPKKKDKPSKTLPERSLRVARVSGGAPALTARSVPELMAERSSHVEAIRRIDAEFDRRERELHEARAALGSEKAA